MVNNCNFAFKQKTIKIQLLFVPGIFQTTTTTKEWLKPPSRYHTTVNDREKVFVGIAMARATLRSQREHMRRCTTIKGMGHHLSGSRSQSDRSRTREPSQPTGNGYSLTFTDT